MEQYYNKADPKRSATLWTARLIKYTWEGIKYIWTERNSKLHKTSRIKELEGITVLKEAIKQEPNKGIGSLSTGEFSKYFRAKIDHICSSEDRMMQWFQVVRQGRILMDKRNLINDEFAANKALQH